MLILFWNPSAIDDVAVRASVALLVRIHRLPIAVETASAREVASFGSITRGVQVFGTPTLLIVNRRGKVKTLTGLQDPYAIAQAIEEARTA